MGVFMKSFLKHPCLIIVVCLLLTVGLAIPLCSISIENTVRRYMPTSSDSYKRLIETEEQFGSMISIGISLETEGETILTPEYVSVIQKITEMIENLDGVESVDSVGNIDFVYSLDGGLAAGSLIDDDYSGTNADMKKIKEKIIDWQEMYNRVIVDDNFKAAQIVATVDSSLNSKELISILHQIQDIAGNEIVDTNLSVRYYGDAVLSDNASNYMLSDLVRLIPLVVLVVLISLYFSFHTVPGTLLPLIAVLISTVWTCGLMTIFNVTFTIVASVIPVALIACGSAYGIHVITHYYAFLDKVEGEMTKEKHLDAICAGLKDVWMAVLLAAITTVAGFISLVTSPINPLKSFAVFTALGIVFSLILSITFIPAMLYVTPLNKVGKRLKSKKGLSARLKRKIQREFERRSGATIEEANGKTLYSIYHFFTGTKSRLVVFSVAIIALSAWGISRLVIDTSLVNYFPPSSKFRTDVDYVDKNFAGTNSLYFVISGEEKGAMTNPEILKAVDDMQMYLDKKYDGIGKAVSFTTFIKRMNQVMHAPMLEASDDISASYNSSDSDYAEDDWGDSTDWGDDDWGSSDDWESESTESENVAETKVWVDPNIEYARILNSQITVQEALQLFADAYSAAGGKNATVEGMTTELEKSLNFNGSAYYEIPYNLEKYPATTREGLSNLVSQYLLLYGGSLDRFSDDPLAPQTIRMQVQLRSHSTSETKMIIDDAKAYAAKYFPNGYTIVATGNGEMELSMSDMVISSQFTSILFSIILVFLIIAISFRSPIAGILGALPLAFTIILNYMVMGFAGIHLDLVTSIIASVAIGVGIDYTIHFMESYKQLREKSKNVEDVTLKTFAVSGHGIVTNAFAVGLGFLVLVFSKFEILRYIGVLAATVMFSSSFLAMTIIPGVLNAFDPAFMQSKEEREQNKIEDATNNKKE